MLLDEYFVSGDRLVQACSGGMVASYPEQQGCFLYGRGVVMHGEMSIKAGAR